MTGRGITLCADDFALHPLVDEAVLRLAQAGRLSATSCMSTAPRWRAAAPRLLPLRGPKASTPMAPCLPTRSFTVPTRAVLT